MFLKMFIAAIMLVGTVCVHAQSCHEYAMPKLMEEMNYKQFNEVIEDVGCLFGKKFVPLNKLPKSKNEYIQFIEKAKNVFCSKDKNDESLYGKLPDYFSFSPSKEVTRYISALDASYEYKNKFYIGKSYGSQIEQKDKMEACFHKKNDMKFIVSMMLDKDYQDQSVSARKESASRSLNNTNSTNVTDSASESIQPKQDDFANAVINGWINKGAFKSASSEQYSSLLSYNKTQCHAVEQQVAKDYVKNSHDDTVFGPLAAYIEGKAQAQADYNGHQAFLACMYEKGWVQVAQ